MIHFKVSDPGELIVRLICSASGVDDTWTTNAPEVNCPQCIELLAEQTSEHLEPERLFSWAPQQAKGKYLDLLATNYALNRYPGESDTMFRSRIKKTMDQTVAPPLVRPPSR